MFLLDSATRIYCIIDFELLNNQDGKMVKRRSRLKTVLVSFGIAFVLVLVILKLFGDEVVKEHHEGHFTVRLIKEKGIPLGPKSYVLELERPGPNGRYPLFTSLDFLSDADVHDYEVASLNFNLSKKLVTIVFKDGYIIEYPVFLGAYSRAEFNQQWQEVYKSEHRGTDQYSNYPK